MNEAFKKLIEIDKKDKANKKQHDWFMENMATHEDMVKLREKIKKLVRLFEKPSIVGLS